MKEALKRALILAVIAAVVFTTAEAESFELTNGSNGALVEAIQSELIVQGKLSGNADGVYGNQTAKAVESVQEGAGLPVTGSVDLHTYYAIYATRYVDPYPTGKDALQTMYYLLHLDMSVDEVLSFLDMYGLPYKDKEYNGSRMIKVAFTEGVTWHTHAETGDYIKIHFDEPEHNSGNYILDYIEYFASTPFFSMYHYADRMYVIDYETYTEKQSPADVPELLKISTSSIDEQFERMEQKR